MFQIKKGREQRIELLPEFTRVSDNTVIGRTEWIDIDGIWDERYEVLTFRGGKIIDMQGCASRREAERFARRH
jgi:hypothetical protein